MLAALSRLAHTFTTLSQRFIPSAFSIALILTFVTFGLAMAIVGAGPGEAVIAWGNGFWTLIPFAMQMSLVVLTGFLVSTAPVVDRLFARLARVPSSPRGMVVLMAVVSMVLAWVHWGLSLVGCAMFVRHAVRAQPKADYRLLVCAAYFGMGATWHAGLSGSATLLVATPGHFLEPEIGIIPVTATIFHPFNLALSALVLVLMAALAWAMHPPADDAVTIAPAELDRLERFEPPARPAERTVAVALDHARWLNLAIGACGAGWLVWYFATNGLVLTLDVLNFAFLMLAILLHGSPASVLAAADQGARLLAGVVLQFPFYAGMYGVIQGTGLARALGEWIASVATPASYPLLLYWYSGLVNYFVPSGGSKWAIEAPFLVEAARLIGVSLDQVVVAYAWGDMATNIIQPFWALPLLAAARLDFRDIMGYATLVFLIYVSVVSVAFWLLPGLW
ncbi:MAG: short-chain fatty acid transporter [Vicinamibacterales bacterium]